MWCVFMRRDSVSRSSDLFKQTMTFLDFVPRPNKTGDLDKLITYSVKLAFARCLTQRRIRLFEQCRGGESGRVVGCRNTT